jgi:prenyltransferase beta subunit/predicted esterase
MRRFALLAFCFLVVGRLATAQSPAELAETAHLLHGMQNADGGFSVQPGGDSSLGATSSVVKCLKYSGGSIPDPLAAIAYVKKCIDPDTGGFAAKPGGEVNVHTTAVGLMALGELQANEPKIVENAIAYLNENAKTFEEIRIAVAGLEGVEKSSHKFADWAKVVNEGRNADGTWGSGDTAAYATGGAAVALLRMGLPLDKKEAVVELIKKSQLPDGGWSKDGKTSDLDSSYRIGRCLFMLNEPPDLDSLRRFIASHRQGDGSYSSTPDGGNNRGGLYHCLILSRWARILDGGPAFLETAGYVPLFNGRDLEGWEGDKTLWSAKGGAIVGTSPGIDKNNFLATEKSYTNYSLKLRFRLRGDENGNSGVQFRSVRIPNNHEMSGYQADIGQGYWGCLYDESRRNKVLVQASDQAVAGVRHGGWNTYEIRAFGNMIQLTLNGRTSVTYTENEPDIARSGKIALQIHAGGPMTIEFKDIWIQEAPDPASDDADTPGFHLRKSGDRAYTVYLPRDYDGSKAVPIMMFLHGSGERGSDGLLSAEDGIGPAIVAHPERFPCIVLIPQARMTWRDGSDDAAFALDLLKDAMQRYKVDPSKVILTGLSMGGSGSWSIAAAHPQMFSAVVPICGAGDDATALATRDMPTWLLIGDADSDRTLQRCRSMVQALRGDGHPPRYTEYRGVPHNSWDRTYNDPAVIEWMLSHSLKPKL